MQIIIANKSAVLKKGTSFDFVSENRLFSGSDSYSMTITFPLKDCATNLAIFGHINRADVALGKAIFDCEIRDKGFYKFGSITITEINDTEVKTQFLEGRSEQNFDKTFDKVYINELDLGEPPTTSISSIYPEYASYPNYHGMKCVCLPWVNDASGNIQNCANYVVDDAVQQKGHYEWNTTEGDPHRCRGLSWQPYLLYITEEICRQIGYTCDFSEWRDNEEYKYFIICNTLPFVWYMPEFAKALPHWTVEEYFEKLELFMGCEFNFDHRARHITFAFTRPLLQSKGTVHLENVVEEHSTEVKMADDDARCDYLASKNIIYKDCDHATWKYYSCDWYIKSLSESQIKRYATMTQLLEALKGWATWDGQHHRSSDIDKVYYAADADSYFIPVPRSRSFSGKWVSGTYVISCKYKMTLTPLNQFGGRIVNESDNAETVELDLVPVRIAFTDARHGKCMFLAFQGQDDDNSTSEDESAHSWSYPTTQQTLKAGEKDKKAEYYDRLYIGFWDGAQDLAEGHKLFHPYVESVVIDDDWSHFRYNRFNMRLNNRQTSRYDYLPKIEPRLKTTFKFLIGETDTLPDPRSLFLIRGKRYVCEKLTATFTENGMSRQVKGVFYPVQEN